MAHQFAVRQSSLWTAIHNVANRPDRTAAHLYIKDGRACLVLVATAAVAINAWALFPSRGGSGADVQLPTASPPSAAVKSALDGVVGGGIRFQGDTLTLNAAVRLSSEPTEYGPAAWYPSPAADVSQVSLRSKLQALLMLLYSQSDIGDPAALEAKLQALLTLPDSVLAQLLEHPDLADLKKTLDAVFLGTTDLSAVKTELDKIDVTSVQGPSEKIDVVNVNGKPAYIVHTSADQMGAMDAAGSSMSALPSPPGGPVTVTVVSLVLAPARQVMSAFTVAPTTEQLAPPPAPVSLSASAFTVAPTTEQLAPPPVPVSLSASAFTVAATTEQLAPPPLPTSTPTATAPTASLPTSAPETFRGVISSGNKFEPGEAAAQQTANNPPATNSPETHGPRAHRAMPGAQTAARGGGSRAEAAGEDVTGPSANESGSTSSGGGTSP
ncbi:hypothetical protein A5724_06060 [Mycobacterium sp. ACS1612]|uniref:hypothetical protein n=1 Tax=Mycobacterium sp. ACS1612 TaxID=1834117 RepID=UPI0007FCF109|nr:hypothetical protein [Mycobacterium sp. ACS1612]OBF41129.1 hypothetical protein A5724_06060 [Mycobacterium sp. ACS1612]